MELWDLFDENRIPTGKIHTRGIKVPARSYHIVVEIFTINTDGKILLTQRDPVKTHSLLWEGTGGSITCGETSLEGAIRELEEETGLTARCGELHKIGELKRGDYFLDSYIWKSSKEITLENLKLQAGEVCDAQFVRMEELEKMNEEALIVPTVWERFKLYNEDLEQLINFKTEKTLNSFLKGARFYEGKQNRQNGDYHRWQ